MHESAIVETFETMIFINQSWCDAVVVDPRVRVLIDEAIGAIKTPGREDQYTPHHYTQILHMQVHGELAAVVLWEPMVHAGQRYGFIGIAYTRPMYRRVGHYAALLRWLMAAHKVNGLVMCAYESNTDSIAAHTALGFKVYDHSNGLVSMELANTKERSTYEC